MLTNEVDPPPRGRTRLERLSHPHVAQSALRTCAPCQCMERGTQLPSKFEADRDCRQTGGMKGHDALIVEVEDTDPVPRWIFGEVADVATPCASRVTEGPAIARPRALHRRAPHAPCGRARQA